MTAARLQAIVQVRTYPSTRVGNSMYCIVHAIQYIVLYNTYIPLRRASTYSVPLPFKIHLPCQSFSASYSSCIVPRLVVSALLLVSSIYLRVAEISLNYPYLSAPGGPTNTVFLGDLNVRPKQDRANSNNSHLHGKHMPGRFVSTFFLRLHLQPPSCFPLATCLEACQPRADRFPTLVNQLTFSPTSRIHIDPQHCGANRGFRL